MRTSASNSGRGLKISLAICLPSNNQSWRDEVASPRPKHNRGVPEKIGQLSHIMRYIPQPADCRCLAVRHAFSRYCGILLLDEKASKYLQRRNIIPRSSTMGKFGGIT